MNGYAVKGPDGKFYPHGETEAQAWSLCGVVTALRLVGTVEIQQAKNAGYTCVPVTLIEGGGEPVCYVNLDRWLAGKHWPDDCFSDQPAGDQQTPLFTHPPYALALLRDTRDWIAQLPKTEDGMRLLERIDALTGRG